MNAVQSVMTWQKNQLEIEIGTHSHFETSFRLPRAQFNSRIPNVMQTIKSWAHLSAVVPSVVRPVCMHVCITMKIAAAVKT